MGGKAHATPSLLHHLLLDHMCALRTAPVPCLPTGCYASSMMVMDVPSETASKPQQVSFFSKLS